ncbi:MAG: DUF2281 domain-containing protein [Pyrinomonadaceae bacterium MAG19_C2-C3]|nr:DUF2281 domain-containing protein [Pyrinomonadaceae bacterium MAG19_C2-C3]
MQTETLIEKIKSLPPERVSEIEDFVDFIADRNNRSMRHDAIAEYAAKHGGSIADLDAKLEAASLEHLFDIERVNP